VVCGSDGQSGTWIEIRHDGRYRVRHVAGNHSEVLTPHPAGGWRPHPALRTDRSFNTVGVATRDRMLVISFNGEWACDVVDDAYEAGLFLQLAASTGEEPARADFQRLRVWPSPDQPPPDTIGTDAVITNSIGMKLTLIPSGEFLMGSPDSDKDAHESEKPQHRVRITRPFYLGVYEVTRGQFRRFVDETGYQTQSERDGEEDYSWRKPGFDQSDDHPVVQVSWKDAVEFATWLSRKEGRTYRLPTEAEWEYACRAGTTTRYSNGEDTITLALMGNVADGTLKERFPNWGRVIKARDGFVNTAPVGRFRPNRFGLFDMHGNVYEWCSDWYDPVCCVTDHHIPS
jgi:formylglycine-generating enzyme required for sulfatase activity